MRKTDNPDAALLALDDLIQLRINYRLRGWPVERREDVMQDVRLKMLIVLRKLGSDLERPAAYCQRVLDNQINDSLRALASERKFVVLDSEYIDDTDPADTAAANELAAGLTLTPKQKRLLELLNTLGSTAAIAKHLGVSTQTASERISRLRRAIREQISDRAA